MVVWLNRSVARRKGTILAKTHPRVVSLEPSCTDLVFSMGREDWLCGVTSLCRKIPTIGERLIDLELPSMGRTNHPRYELMEKIRPDLVLTANWASPVMLNELVSRHFNVVSLNPESWDDVLRNIRLLGWLLDAEKAADEMSERLEQEMKRLLRAAADLPAVPTIYIETQTKPVAFAPDWVREMVEFSGGIDAYADRRGDRTDGRIVSWRDVDAVV